MYFFLENDNNTYNELDTLNSFDYSINKSLEYPINKSLEYPINEPFEYPINKPLEYLKNDPFDKEVSNNLDQLVSLIFTNSSKPNSSEIGKMEEILDNFEEIISLIFKQNSTKIVDYDDMEEKNNKLIKKKTKIVRETQRKKVSLKYFYRFPQKLTSKMLGLPPSTLNKRWKSASQNQKWPQRFINRIIKTIKNNLVNRIDLEQTKKLIYKLIEIPDFYIELNE